MTREEAVRILGQYDVSAIQFFETDGREIPWDKGHEALEMAIEALAQLPSAQPELHYDEWCTDCKEYDQTKHCCPRFNKVIKNTLKDVQSVTHKNAHWTNIQLSVTGTSTCECSLCGAIVHSSFSDKISYCPNCGAFMLGDALTLDSLPVGNQCYAITDDQFKHASKLTFHTDHGEEFKFVKEPQWISCDERLPENKQECLLTIVVGGRKYVVTGTYSTDLYSVNKYDFADRKGVSGWYYRDEEYGYIEYYNRVIAWLPLPKPYEGDTE